MGGRKNDPTPLCVSPKVEKTTINNIEMETLDQG